MQSLRSLIKCRGTLRLVVVALLASTGAATAAQLTQTQVEEVTTTLKHLGTATEVPTDAQVDGVPSALKRNADCMYKVLLKVPGISEAKLGYVTRNGWTTPFLEYRAEEKSSWVGPTHFEAQKVRDTYVFEGLLPGVGDLDTHVTEVVVKRWSKQCQVVAMVVLG
jgi:hypothetical protein